MYENYIWDELGYENRELSLIIENLKINQIQERALGDEPPEYSMRFILDLK
jgi:hypothetical protein